MPVYHAESLLVAETIKTKHMKRKLFFLVVLLLLVALICTYPLECFLVAGVITGIALFVSFIVTVLIIASL
jgi:hypothetical protein